MVFFWQHRQIEFKLKPISDFGNRLQWFFSVLYDNNDKTKIFFFTVFGLHFFYMCKKRPWKKFAAKAESVMFKVDGSNAQKIKLKIN